MPFKCKHYIMEHHVQKKILNKRLQWKIKWRTWDFCLSSWNTIFFCFLSGLILRAAWISFYLFIVYTYNIFFDCPNFFIFKHFWWNLSVRSIMQKRTITSEMKSLIYCDAFSSVHNLYIDPPRVYNKKKAFNKQNKKSYEWEK